jgi:hypothetical protein
MNLYNNQIVKPKKKPINPKQTTTMNMGGIYPGNTVGPNMMVSGNATGINQS